MPPFESKQAWETAVAAAYRRASIDLGMDHDESEAYALKQVGAWETPTAPAPSAPVSPRAAADDPKPNAAPEAAHPPAAPPEADLSGVPAALVASDAPAAPLAHAAADVAPKLDGAPDIPSRRAPKAGASGNQAAPAPAPEAKPKARAFPRDGEYLKEPAREPEPWRDGTTRPPLPPARPGPIEPYAPSKKDAELLMPKERSQASFVATALGVAFTAAYCVAELCYNMSLVEFVSSANTSADAFENLERVGKMLGALGLSLAVARLFFKGWRAAAAIAVLAPLAYLGIDKGFDAYIEGLPHEAKVEGYYLGAYRSLILSGKLADADFGGPEASIERKVRLLSLPLAIGSGKDPQAKVSNYVFGPEGADAGYDKEIAGLFDVYDSVSRRVDPLYAYYAIESRKAQAHTAFHDKYVEGFMKKSGGIPPGLSKAQFNAEIQKRYPGLARYRATVAIPAQPSLGLAALTMGDIPPGLDQPAFSAFFKNYIAKARATRRMAAEKVETLPESKSIIASAVVPPLSMTLSLVSFGLNLASAAAGLVLLALWPMRGRPAWPWLGFGLKAGLTVAVLGWMLSAPPALTGVAGQWQARASSASAAGAAWSRAINAEAALMADAGPALPAIHRAFIDDSHPDQVKRVTVEKAKEIDMGDLDQKLAEFKSSAEKDDAPQVPDKGFYADEAKVEQKGYYGETRPSGGNPYQKK